MATLMAVYNSQGCVGRCDARCYNAKGPRCRCICGGKNHGVGLAKARDNTARMADAEVRANAREANPDKALRVTKVQWQLELFE